MEKESITSTVWVMYSFLGKNKLMFVRLYWRVEATIPHSTGLVISFACLAFVGSRNAKDGAKLRGVSQRKYDIHMGDLQRISSKCWDISCRLFIEMKSKFGLYSSWHSNCNLRYTLVLKGHYLHNSSQPSSMNFIASRLQFIFYFMVEKTLDLKRFF